MKKTLTYTLIFFQQLCTAVTAYSQDNKVDTLSLSFFLDCNECDFTFVRQELPFVSFVREPGAADIHILVTHSTTGGGGDKFFLNFIGRNQFEHVNFEYIVTTNQSDTDFNIREALLKILKTGILQYYSSSGFMGNINIELSENDNKRADDLLTDRWNKWVFRFDAASAFEKEKSQNDYNFSTQGRIEKITEAWKARLEAELEFDRENYFDDEERITDKQDTKDVSADFIKSITPKWSAGVFTGYSSQTFMNIKNRYNLSAGIEYNIFPWSECNRRVFAIRYRAGARHVSYNEETIYDKLEELLFTESVEINLELIQPWGEVSAGLEGQHYFHDFSKNRLTFEIDLSLRLSKNISVFCELQSDVIHDQLYLPKGDASVEDILLRRRKLATTYETSGQFGFRFTFGSIYNNVVNERF